MKIVISIKKIATYIVHILLTLIILILVYLGWIKYCNNNQYPTVYGYGSAVVISGSMEPDISVNDLVITKKKSTYQKENIVLFHSGTSLITHRIVAKQKNKYLTKGDANNTEDDWLKSNQIEGQVILTIPAVGYIQEFFLTKLGKLGLTIIIIFTIILFFGIERVEERGKP